MNDMNEPIAIDPEMVMASMEKTIGQQAGMLARYESVIQQLQQRIQTLAAKLPDEALSDG